MPRRGPRRHRARPRTRARGHRHLHAGRCSALEIKDALAAARVNVSVSAASWSRLDLDHRGLDSVVRASVHYFNEDEELERLLGVVASL
jgi:selenocysteine lyase/cysteine desulfurase